MKRYRVVLTQDCHKEVIVRARSQEEAGQKALERTNLMHGWEPSGVEADVWVVVEIDAKGNAMGWEHGSLSDAGLVTVTE